MEADNGTDTDPPRSGAVTLLASPDIAATIARPGLLEDRAGVASITRLDPMRSDALLEHVKSNGVSGGVLVTSLHPDVLGPEPLAADQTMANLAATASLLADRDVRLFVFNVSTYDPADRTHSFVGVGDTFAIRAHRTIAALENQAGDAGINVVDVDGAVAEVGAKGNVPAAGDLAGDAIELVTDEAILAIDQSGALGSTLQAPVMRLAIPSFDRRTQSGTLSRWLIAVGDEVKDGDPVLEIRFESRAHRFDMSKDEQARVQTKIKGRSEKAQKFEIMNVTVFAGSDACLHEILLAEGSPVNVGDAAGVVTTEPGVTVSAADATADFRVGARIVEA